ncbi:hypothetical protein E6C76_13645 [Pseudothauera nasutitermitis]|uniref:Barstar (barnase inhibitor) domain-containing protein n=1 Tax=Pseudothauera nasutitermitis TaxID=2565930 RepID=A0A4V3WBL2_9RHOO|nr:barstar family protein [Pseudothauera nasutitermitis]THF63633.1 hypothetical protein E6C76_13645 [Pseudothauera nasutitermitis]
MTATPLSFLPGVHAPPVSDVAALLEAAQAIGARVARVDLSAVADKAGLLDALAAALDFPGWFGRNWDALADCLGDLSWVDAAQVVVLLEHAETLRGAAPDDYATLLEICAEAADALAGEGRVLAVFTVPSGH